MPSSKAAGRVLPWAGIILITIAAYWPSLNDGFIWDDDSSLTNNGLIQAGDGLRRLWLTAEPADYWPVTSTAFWLEWRLWGEHAMGYHAVNLGLHVAEALLLWRILRWFGLRGAYAAALLFAVHPVNVESVAWIAERKNLMAMLFFLLSVRFFLRSGLVPPPPVPAPAAAIRNRVLSFIAYIMGMLSKGSIVMLPAVLIGLIAWRRRLERRDAMALAPFFLAGTVLTAVNVWFQKHHLTEPIREAGGLDRLLGAGAVIWFYLAKAVLPLRLLFVYPPWQVDARDPAWWLPFLAAVFVTYFLWRGWRPALFAWGYFVLSLVPVMGLTDVYFMKYAPVADHYQHVAIIGVVAFFAWRLGRWNRRGLAIGAGMAVCLLAPLTWAQCRLYRDSRSIFQATLGGNPASWLAHVNLGFIQLQQGNDAEARRHFMAALALNPKSAEAHCDLGITFLHAGLRQEAAGEFEESLRLIPSYPQAENGLGLACLDLGRVSEALLHLQRALRLRPNYPEAHNNLGLVMVKAGRLAEAIDEFEAAIRIRPDYANARNNLAAARALQALGRMDVPSSASP